MEWNMEENFSMEWNMEWKIFSMEWKKIVSMEYGKIIFHSIPYHALTHGGDFFEDRAYGLKLDQKKEKYCDRKKLRNTIHFKF